MLFRSIRLTGLHIWSPQRFSSRFSDSGVIAPAGNFQESPAAIMLCELDYPRHFRGESAGSKKYAHPEDYKIDVAPIQPKLFLYKGEKGRNRMFIRISLLLNPKEEVKLYTAATFLLDSGCCPHLNVCKQLYGLIKDRVVKDSSPFDFITLTNNEERHNLEVCCDLPDIHQPANVMGLPMFFTLGLSFRQVNFGSLGTNDDRVVESEVASALPYKFI